MAWFLRACRPPMRRRSRRWPSTVISVTLLASTHGGAWPGPARSQGPEATGAGGAPPSDDAGSEEATGTTSNGDGAADIAAAFGHGFTVTSADRRFEMNLSGRMQIRNTLGVEGGRVDNDLTVRTLRLHWEGHTFTPHFTYTVQLAFGPDELDGDAPSPVFDAYVEYDRRRRAVLRVGQFFVPFDRARMMREWALQFVERQQVVTELGLDRDVGIVLWSPDVLGTGGHLGYHVGLFEGAGRNRIGPRPGLLPVGRLVVRPFGEFEDEAHEGDLRRLPRPRLGIGLAGAYSFRANRAQATTGDAFQFRTARYVHGAADVHFKIRGLSVLAEVLVRQGLRDVVVAAVEGERVEEWSRSGWGYLIQVGYMVTAHLEVVARWEDLATLGETDPDLHALVRDTGREAGAGCNVYLNGHRLKIQADYLARFGETIRAARHEARIAVDVTF